MPDVSKFPGPGQYYTPRNLNEYGNAPSFSFRQKTKFMDFVELNKKKDVPGPGSYHPKDEIGSTTTMNSKYRNPGSIVYSSIGNGSYS